MRRAKKTRYKILKNGKPRLMVYKTPRHIRAQLTNSQGSTIIAQASTLGKSIKTTLKQGGNIEAAKYIGKVIAEHAIKKGVTEVAFDRSGFKYHGRIKALADSARENGLKI